MYSQPASLTQTRDFAQAWGEEAFVQGVLARLPWYHQLALLDKLQTPKERRSPVHQHVYEEQKESLTALVRHHLETASSATSGRSAHTIYGGHEHVIGQALIALRAGSILEEHENPGEATVQSYTGASPSSRVRTGGTDRPAT